jgi:hypothetical protein
MFIATEIDEIIDFASLYYKRPIEKVGFCSKPMRLLTLCALAGLCRELGAGKPSVDPAIRKEGHRCRPLQARSALALIAAFFTQQYNRSKHATTASW